MLNSSQQKYKKVSWLITTQDMKKTKSRKELKTTPQLTRESIKQKETKTVTTPKKSVNLWQLSNMSHWKSNLWILSSKLFKERESTLPITAFHSPLTFMMKSTVKRTFIFWDSTRKSEDQTVYFQIFSKSLKMLKRTRATA